ncbi:MAG: hypothetical protein ACKO4Z_07655 [Planctomycetota bacterium]
MTRLVAITVVVGCLAAATPARAQNDWQFPDPYFGAIEFDASRTPAARSRKPEGSSTPSRARPVRSRPAPRFRARWSAGPRQ